jgi:hypothetical protein
LKKPEILIPVLKNCVWEPDGMNCLRSGTLKHGWIFFLGQFLRPCTGLLNIFKKKKKGTGSGIRKKNSWNPDPVGLKNWNPPNTGSNPPPAMNVKMSKPGTGGSLQKEDPDKTGGYHVYRPTVLFRRSHSSLACAGFQGQTELSELALSERCVASSPPARPRCVWLSRARIRLYRRRVGLSANFGPHSRNRGREFRLMLL